MKGIKSRSSYYYVFSKLKLIPYIFILLSFFLEFRSFTINGLYLSRFICPLFTTATHSRRNGYYYNLIVETSKVKKKKIYISKFKYFKLNKGNCYRFDREMTKLRIIKSKHLVYIHIKMYKSFICWYIQPKSVPKCHPCVQWSANQRFWWS